MGKLDDKIAIVTGGGSGIGQSIALGLAREGCDVALCGRRLEPLQETVRQIEAQGRRALALSVDVSRGEAVQGFVDEVVKVFGRVDILVNNAGVTRDNLLIRMTEEQWDEVLTTNLKGAFLFGKAVARPMMKQRGGSIVQISSIIGLIGNAGQCNYAASKAGLIALTQSMAKELASRNIRVNAVAPGFIVSQMTNALPEALRTKMLGEIPLGRFGAGEDIANAVVFLASEDASYVTGQVLSVNGGMTM
ncbi:MAG: 3-oxoacyl-[acyl-carrier-protein] reductase [Lentisphaerae bacterium]|jgi:3-oxoacyl-[acyl-carrier protein] reductase|nr:3-oxoacyl-[acyl-carrier-protein] reductase [Lentisphaerota bacterium]